MGVIRVVDGDVTAGRGNRVIGDVFGRHNVADDVLGTC